MPRLGEKYEIEIETISKPRQEYKTIEYDHLGLPVAPAIMVGEEIVVEGADISDDNLKEVICNHLGLPPPEPENKGILNYILKR